MDKEKNFGFIPSVIDENTNFILGDGCLPKDIIFPDGHGWGAYLPKDEVQAKNGVETMACTIYGTLNALETLGRKKFGAQFQNDLSERYNAILAGIGPNGGDPHTACEVIRKYGVIPEVFLPFDATITTWQKYYSPNPVTLDLLKTGAHWMQKYLFGHEWCFIVTDSLQRKQLNIKEALKYSTVCVSLYAWSQHPDGLFYMDGNPNHWVEIYDFVEGQYWMAFDSYTQTHKKIAWDTNFGQGKRIHLELNAAGIAEPQPVLPVGIIARILAFFRTRFGGIIDEYQQESGENNNR